MKVKSKSKEKLVEKENKRDKKEKNETTIIEVCNEIEKSNAENWSKRMKRENDRRETLDRVETESLSRMKRKNVSRNKKTAALKIHYINWNSCLR